MGETRSFALTHVPLIQPVTLSGDETLTASRTAPVGKLYSNGAAWPSGFPAFCAAIAIIAENMGHAKLVPPIVTGPCVPLMVSMISTPIYGSASQPTSGTCRIFPGSPLWNVGLAYVRLGPPPAPKTSP